MDELYQASMVKFTRNWATAHFWKSLIVSVWIDNRSLSFRSWRWTQCVIGKKEVVSLLYRWSLCVSVNQDRSSYWGGAVLKAVLFLFVQVQPTFVVLRAWACNDLHIDQQQLPISHAPPTPHTSNSNLKFVLSPCFSSHLMMSIALCVSNIPGWPFTQQLWVQPPPGSTLQLSERRYWDTT